MSFVTVTPDALNSAAARLQSIGAGMADDVVTASAATTGIIPPAVDPVSKLATAQFAAYAVGYQSMAAQAVAVHQQFVAALATSGDSYATAEATNASSTSVTSELITIAETYINGTINAPPQSYLSSIVPYLLGLQVATLGLTALPAAPAEAASVPAGLVDSTVASAGSAPTYELIGGTAGGAVVEDWVSPPSSTTTPSGWTQPAAGAHTVEAEMRSPVAGDAGASAAQIDSAATVSGVPAVGHSGHGERDSTPPRAATRSVQVLPGAVQ